MSDNVSITAGSGTLVSTEEVTTLNGGAVTAQQVQRVAAAIRTADGTAVDLPGSTADGLLVNLGANNDVTVTGSVTANAGTNLNTSTLALEAGGNLAAAATSLAALDNAIAGNEMQVDIVTSALPSGAATSANQSTIIGHLDGVEALLGTIDADTGAIMTAVQLIDNAISGNEMQVDIVSSTEIGVNVLEIVPGTSSTMLGKAEDAPHSSGDVGVMGLAVRRDADTSLVGTDGDYGPLQLNAAGSLKVAITAGAGSGGTSIADGAGFTADSTSLTVIGGYRDDTSPATVTEHDAAAARLTEYRAIHVNLRDSAGAELTVGGAVQYAEDAAHASGDQLTMAGAVRRDTPASGAGADGDNATFNMSSTGRLWVSATIDAAIPAGTNNIGDVDVLSLPALAAGTNNIGDVDILTIAAGDNNIGNVDIVTMPNVTLAAGTNTNEVVGDAAHDAAVAGNPVLIGIEARAADGTAVSASGDVVRLMGSTLGKPINIPYAIPASTWTYAGAAGGLVNTTGVTAKTAAGAGIRNYVTRAQVINSHQTTGTEVLIRDGAAGTVLWRGWAQFAGGGVSAVFDPPLRGTANTLIEIAEVTTTATAGVLVNLQGFISAE